MLCPTKQWLVLLMIVCQLLCECFAMPGNVQAYNYLQKQKRIRLGPILNPKYPGRRPIPSGKEPNDPPF